MSEIEDLIKTMREHTENWNGRIFRPIILDDVVTEEKTAKEKRQVIRLYKRLQKILKKQKGVVIDSFP